VAARSCNDSSQRFWEGGRQLVGYPLRSMCVEAAHARNLEAKTLLSQYLGDAVHSRGVGRHMRTVAVIVSCLCRQQVGQERRKIDRQLRFPVCAPVGIVLRRQPIVTWAKTA
jgi:hypothetical protein